LLKKKRKKKEKKRQKKKRRKKERKKRRCTRTSQAGEAHRVNQGRATIWEYQEEEGL